MPQLISLRLKVGNGQATLECLVLLLARAILAPFQPQQRQAERAFGTSSVHFAPSTMAATPAMRIDARELRVDADFAAFDLKWLPRKRRSRRIPGHGNVGLRCLGCVIFDSGGLRREVGGIATLGG